MVRTQLTHNNTCKVFGAGWCGFTKKQIAALDGGMRDTLKARGVDVAVTDCAAPGAQCPVGIDGYPTWQNASGLTMGGFVDDVEKIAAFCGDTPPPQPHAPGKCELFGAGWCGFTKKQIAALDSGMRDTLKARGVDVAVTDCAAPGARCPVDVEGYPTWQNAAGRRMAGFVDDADKIVAFCA